MSVDYDDLGELFVAVTGGESVTDEQQEDQSRAPVNARTATIEAEAVATAREDGFEEAVAGADTEP